MAARIALSVLDHLKSNLIPAWRKKKGQIKTKNALIKKAGAAVDR